MFHHEALGDIIGAYSEDKKTIQFRGLKYATIPGRWEDSILNIGLLSEDGEVYDARNHGPACPQHPGGLELDQSLIGDARLQAEQIEQSELECLNLVITTPTTISDLLPVLVWVHGGGLSIGSNAWPQYDLRNFVESSIATGNPVIGVSINYRLGIFGFLASDELRTQGNYGFKDQICAFQWIKANIKGFGGNPDNITAMGESAGAISISTLLFSNLPLFTRSILMSGEATLRKPRQIQWHNVMYEENLTHLGLDHFPMEDRRHLMFTKPAHDLVNNLPLAQHFCAVIDGEFLKSKVDLGALSSKEEDTGSPEWCKEIVVGDCLHDGTILKSRFINTPNALDLLSSSVDQVLGSHDGQRLLASYGLASLHNEDDHRFKLLGLVSDLRFYLPLLQVELGWSKRRNQSCFTYHFHHLNPFSGDHRQLASHELDVALLLQNYNTFLPRESEAISKSMADIFLGFICGHGWIKAPREVNVVVFGPEAQVSVTSTSGYDMDFRRGRGALLTELGWRRCFLLAEMLQGVRI